ncbi:DUF4150 domain-containing protein [Nannocystis sp. RBIL2]|uniref:DUF4150 domain-containing protein n=1 Tax=Nannocystis sp. RBIL2 TaxID=2996788 RepID=UPI00226EA881|nr:DUF4150 domain-containing protein [Nannocystis sp. RBIL2]MCY1064208.1 DUF4150 domain-containing protein [Nannocystis sp. RBIL2]
MTSRPARGSVAAADNPSAAGLASAAASSKGPTSSSSRLPARHIEHPARRVLCEHRCALDHLDRRQHQRRQARRAARVNHGPHRTAIRRSCSETTHQARGLARRPLVAPPRVCNTPSEVSVFADSRKVTHKGSGQTEVAAPPDVCKTPTPGGPVPVPYVNAAQDSQLAGGSKRTAIEGNPIALASSNLRTSTGDEPGTAGGGLMSNKVKGKLTWGSSSPDVLVEGKGVVRFMDVTQHNGNSFNTAFIEQGGTGFAYGDDFERECPLCKKSPESHAIKEETAEESSLDIAQKILRDLKAREDGWKKANEAVASATAELERQLKMNPNMKPATIEARKANIAGLTQSRDALASHRRDDSGGYMFGVMVCLTGKKFAAVSGDEVPDGFKAIAAKHGCTIVAEAATVADFQAMNSRPDAVATAWGDVMDRYETGVPGYNNMPGKCAGAKLVGKSGHIARSMTEIYFPFTGGKKALTFSVIYRGPEQFAPAGGPWTPPTTEATAVFIAERRDMRRRSELTVPSCRACQDTLYMARCDLEGKSCG